MWKDVMIKEMSSLHKNDTWELLELPKRKKAIIVSEYLQKNKNIQMVILYATKPDW